MIDPKHYSADRERALKERFGLAVLALNRQQQGEVVDVHGEVRVLEKAAKVTAYGVCRKFGRGRVVGPVIAASSTQAKELINGFIAAYPEEFLRVDTPQASNLSPWLISVGLNVAGKGWSMRRSPRTPVPNTHALASQALG